MSALYILIHGAQLLSKKFAPTISEWEWSSSPNLTNMGDDELFQFWLMLGIEMVSYHLHLHFFDIQRG